jgi:hypothetical protein
MCVLLSIIYNLKEEWKFIIFGYMEVKHIWVELLLQVFEFLELKSFVGPTRIRNLQAQSFSKIM